MNYPKLFHELAEGIAKSFDGQLYFTSEGVNYISKPDQDGEWKTKKAIKDPNYKGHRYIWEEELLIN